MDKEHVKGAADKAKEKSPARVLGSIAGQIGALGLGGK